jgi:tRNA (adenine37-N6)-methyltransferase
MTTDAVFDVRPIGVVRSSYRDLADIPPQAAANADVTADVIVRADMNAALLGLDRYPAVWLLTWLDAGRTGDPPLQLVPRATQATGEVQGVFASRAPARPNPIGLHLVRLVGVADNVVTFAGVDLLDGTPVLDIKPWFADCDLPARVS